jgi:hypothetical protein
MPMIEASISCPKCRKGLSIPLAQMAPGSSYPCPNCGEVLTFAGQDASKIQDIIDQLGKQLPGVSVEVKVETKRPWWKFWGA